jgi:uncharacterized protein
MKGVDYEIPRQNFEALASGGGGPDAVRELAAAERGKHAVLLWGVRSLDGGPSVTSGAGMARNGYELLIKVQRHDPASAAAIIRYPAVGAWALHVIRASRGWVAMPGARPDQLSAVAAAAAIRAGLPAEIEVPVSTTPGMREGDGEVILPSLGVASASGATATVRVVADGDSTVESGGRCIRVPANPHHDAPGWRAVRRFRAGSLEVLIDDLDPFRMPAMPNVAPRLTAAEFRTWIATLQEAWVLLERHHGAAAAEVAETITAVTPLMAQDEGNASSSSRQSFGAIAMSEPPDQYECAVTLVHETQHLKLSALTDIMALTRPDNGLRLYAPWRPDPRPVSGLLQGTYAYLGVGRFWRQQRHVASGVPGLRAHIEFARWRAGAALAAKTLRSSGQLTEAGTDFVDGMARTLDSWQEEPVPAEAQARADYEAAVHLARWEQANGPIQA